MWFIVVIEMSELCTMRQKNVERRKLQFSEQRNVAGSLRTSLHLIETQNSVGLGIKCRPSSMFDSPPAVNQTYIPGEGLNAFLGELEGPNWTEVFLLVRRVQYE